MELTKQIFNAIIKRDIQKLDTIVTSQINLNQIRDNDEMTPLMLSCLLRNVQIVSFLLDKGADPDLQDKDGFSSLMWAAQDGYLEIVTLLLEKGANPALKSLKGWSALDLARTSQHRDVEARLLKSLSPKKS